jgi:hypothetical protein
MRHAAGVARTVVAGVLVAVPDEALLTFRGEHRREPLPRDP